MRGMQRRSMRLARGLTTAAGVLVLAACATDHRVALPADLPGSFEHAGAARNSAWPSRDWYRGFGSAELDALIDAAVTGNLDLAAAGERVAQADARARQAGAAILPSVNANANANYLAGHSSQGGGHELDWFAMLSATYEVDFWGKNRATATAARLEARASRTDRDTVALTLLGGLADQYFQVLALRERIALARSNTEASGKVLEAVQARFAAGVATPVELAAQRAAYDTTRISLADLEQSEVQARAALAVLLGRPPENFQVTGTSMDALTEPAIGAHLPAELLTRRPDVALAETKLRAASANVVAARAAMLPSLSLTASGGVQNPALPATILTIGGTGSSFQLAANLLQPIFDRGKLRAQRDEVVARERELLTGYRAAVLAALVDVENALAALEHLDAVREFESDNVAQSERAFAGAQARYGKGAGDFLTLLEAQRTLYAARDQYTQYRLARLQALVALCKALGGGWSADGARGN